MQNISLYKKGPAKEALLKDLRDRLGLKEKVKVSPGSNPKVDWHGDEGEHGTHNEAKKGSMLPFAGVFCCITEVCISGDVYITLKPSKSAHDLPADGHSHH